MATLLSEIVRQVRNVLTETSVIVRPASPLVSPQGTPGVTTYGYKIVATNAVGSTDAGPQGSTTTGAVTLNGTNFNRLMWVKSPKATGYDVYRTVGGATQGKIGSVGDVDTFDDTGLAGATSAPTTNTSGLTKPFWTDTELLEYMIDGIRDLWRKLVDQYQEHFFTVNEDDVTLPANVFQLAGVPSDIIRLVLIEAIDSDGETLQNVRFTPAKYNSPEFKRARAMSAVEASSQETEIYFDVTDAGGPVGAPTIRTAPRVSAALALRFVYVPTIDYSEYGLSTTNPIPGESDKALKAYTIAFALSKNREDRSPDPNWIATYATEAGSIQVVTTPRQEVAPQIVRGVFDDWYDFE